MICYHHLWLLFLFSPAVYTQTTDKYTDENRPYKFGFNIQGYQHRQEQKDEKGIIKGEYGFITADGYYRVTVYATDENGDFRIISMKNYYVGFPPEDPTTTPGSPTARQGGAGLKPFGAIGAGRSEEGSKGPTVANGPVGTSAPQKEARRPQGLSACSDCYIPTTTTTTKPSFGFPGGGDGKGAVGGKFNDGPGGGGGGGRFGQGQKQREKFPGPLNLNSIPDIPSRSPPGSNFQQEKTPQLQSGPGGGQSPGSFGGFGDPRSPGGFGAPGTSGFTNPSGTPGTPGAPGAPGAPRTPGSQPFGGNNLQNQNVPGTGRFGSDRGGRARGQIDALQNNGIDDTPNRKPQIGEVRDGLPPGVPLSAVKDLLLYRFNYTVGFHGHHEDGYRNGDKEGDYFFDGRDGVERKVEYVANEFGYQPNITLIDLPENDVRRPKEETEKEYGLKGYEFKWFYRR